MTRAQRIRTALFSVAAVLVVWNFLAFLSEGTIPRRPIDGVDVEYLIGHGAFGGLKPGDVRRLQQLLGRDDRFVVLGSTAPTRYGGPIANARLLLGSMLIPRVMVTRCRDANVVIVLDPGHGRCGIRHRPFAVLRSSVAVYRFHP